MGCLFSLSSSFLQSLETGAYRSRSFPTECLAESYTSTKAIKEAHLRGKSRALHKQIFIVGNKGAGKTSTLKNLTCQEFSCNETGTKGAETFDARAHYYHSKCMWKAEDKNVSNSARFLMQAGIQKIAQQSSLLQEIAFAIFLLAFAGFVFAVNYVGKNSLITAALSLVMAVILFHRNPDIIGRVMLVVVGSCVLFDFFLVMFLQEEMNLMIDFAVVCIIGCILGFLFFTSTASGFFLCCIIRGVAPGYLLNAKCITITSTLYAQSAVFFAFGMVLGFFVERMTTNVPKRWLLYACLILISNVLVACLFSILGISPPTEGETMLQYLQRNSEKELVIIVVIWTSIGILFTTWLKCVLLPTRSTVFYLAWLPMNMSKSELTRKWWFHCASCTVGAVFALPSIALLTWKVDSFCGQLFIVSFEFPYLYNVATFFVLCLLELVYWFPETLSSKPSSSLRDIVTPNFFSTMTKVMDEGDSSISDLLQPLLKIIDFAGEEIYYSMHHMFLRDNGIYLIVFKFKDFGKTEQEAVINWVKSAYSYGGKNGKAFLVGTHRNSCSEMERNKAVYDLYEELKKRGGDGLVSFVHFDKQSAAGLERTWESEVLSLVFQIENSNDNHEDATLVRLRDQILDEYNVLREKDTREYSSTVFKVEEEIMKEKEDLNGLPPIVTKTELRGCIKRAFQSPPLQKNDFNVALEYLNESGVIHTCTRYQRIEFQRYVVLRPQFLINATEALVSSHAMLKMNEDLAEDMESFYTQGILSKSAILEVWNERGIYTDENTNFPLLGILEESGIIAKVSQSKGRWENYGIIPCFPTQIQCQPKLEENNSFYVVLSNAFGIHRNIFCVLMAKARLRSDRPLTAELWSKFYGKFRLTLTFPSLQAPVHVDYVMQCYKNQEVFRISYNSTAGPEAFRELIRAVYDMLLEVKEAFFPLISFDIGVQCPIHQRHSVEANETKFDEEDDCFAPTEHIIKLLRSEKGEEQFRHQVSLFCQKTRPRTNLQEYEAVKKWLKMDQLPRYQDIIC